MEEDRRAFKILTGKQTKRDWNGEWRSFHNEELHSFYRSPNIVRMIKSRKLRWADNVARTEEGGSDFKIWPGKPKGKEINAEVLLNACKEICLAVNTEKTKYMEVGRS